MASAQTAFGFVQFGDAFVEMEESFKLCAGVKPNINRATCDVANFLLLGDTPGGMTADLQFFDFDDENPSLTISKITLIDFEPIEYGVLATDDSGTPPYAIKYRLHLADQRWGFAEPRGGRLTYGLINPSTPDIADPDQTQIAKAMSMSDLITACLAAMNISAGPPDTDVDAPQDLKWLGTHAPTELEKLLGMANCVLCLQPDGSFDIHAIGDGAMPEIPEGQALPATILKGADGRGKTVVFASFPTQQAIQSKGSDSSTYPSGTFQIVAPNSDGAWQLIDNCGQYGSDAISALNKHFKDTTAASDAKLQHLCYRCLRIDPDFYDPVIQPLLRKTWADPSSSNSSDPLGLPPQIDIALKAKVATQDPVTKTWMMSGDLVNVPIVQIRGDGTIVLGLRLVKLKAGGPQSGVSDLDANCDKIDMADDLQFSFSVGDAEWDSTLQIFKPQFFYCGFTGTADAPSPMASSEAAEAAMNQPGTIIIPIAELQAVRDGSGASSEAFNQSALIAKCQKLAGRYLQDPANPAQLLAGVGFLPVTIDGIVGEVEIDQKMLITRYKTSSFFRPAGNHMAEELKRHRHAHHESHPHEAKTQGKRSALNHPGSNQPVAAEGAFFTDSPSAGDLIFGTVVQDGGQLGNTSETIDATYTFLTKTGATVADGSNTGAVKKTPIMNIRYPLCIYTLASNWAIAAYDVATPPNLILLFVNEVPAGGDCTGVF